MNQEVVRNLIIGGLSAVVLFLLGFAPVWMAASNQALAGTRLSPAAMPVGESRGSEMVGPVNATQPRFADANELFQKKTR